MSDQQASEDVKWAIKVKRAHYIDHAPSSKGAGPTIPFKRCEAYICEEAREILDTTEPAQAGDTKKDVSLRAGA